MLSATLSSGAMSGSTVDWLLDSDPSVRWQVMRDLLDCPEPEWTAERARVATEGWGARLLSCEDEDGQWAGGAFLPRGFDFREWQEVGQPWTATAFSLSQLREFGLDPSSRPGPASRRADRRQLTLGPRRRALLGGRSRGVHQRPDRCRRRLLRCRRLAPRRPADGRAPRRRRLELRAGQRLGPLVVRQHHQRARRAPGVRASHRRHAGVPRGTHSRARSTCWSAACSAALSTGEPADDQFLSFLYPSRWRYDVLRALDYFRSAAALTDAAPDPRLGDAVDHVRSRRQEDGTWLLDWSLPGRVWFEMDDGAGKPSVWVTLRAMRVLRWWDRS